MCLEPGWFEESDQRIARWNRDGVTIDEAKSRLATLGSTVYPVGEEMAKWLYCNWTAEKLDALGSPYRELVVRYFTPSRAERTSRGASFWSPVRWTP